MALVARGRLLGLAAAAPLIAVVPSWDALRAAFGLAAWDLGLDLPLPLALRSAGFGAFSFPLALHTSSRAHAAQSGPSPCMHTADDGVGGAKAGAATGVEVGAGVGASAAGARDDANADADAGADAEIDAEGGAERELKIGAGTEARGGAEAATAGAGARAGTLGAEARAKAGADVVPGARAGRGGAAFDGAKKEVMDPAPTAVTAASPDFDLAFRFIPAEAPPLEPPLEQVLVVLLASRAIHASRLSWYPQPLIVHVRVTRGEDGAEELDKDDIEAASLASSSPSRAASR